MYSEQKTGLTFAVKARITSVSQQQRESHQEMNTDENKDRKAFKELPLILAENAIRKIIVGTPPSQNHLLFLVTYGNRWWWDPCVCEIFAKKT